MAKSSKSPGSKGRHPDDPADDIRIELSTKDRRRDDGEHAPSRKVMRQKSLLPTTGKVSDLPRRAPRWWHRRLDPRTIPAHTVLAAGGVLWRISKKAAKRGVRADSTSPVLPGIDDIEIALVHRTRYDDWSLPKGKVDEGESLPVTAMREIWEETGYTPQLGKFLAVVSYPVKKKQRKEVYYWSAYAAKGDFSANNEVDELRWLPMTEAAQQVSYPLDRKVLKKFTRWPATANAVLLVRHARAGSREFWEGDDALRPLDKLGRAQAEALVGQCLAFKPDRIVTADRVRCEQTVAPLAQEAGLAVEKEKFFSEEGYLAAPEEAQRRFQKIIDSGGVTTVCSQGGVIPHLVDWLAERDHVRIDKSATKKAGMWILIFRNGRLIGADTLVSPLPVS